MNMENAVNGNELNEEVIPNYNNTPNDNQLDDVIPCEPVEYEEQYTESIPAFGGNNGLYNETYATTPSVPVTEMIDIAPNVVRTGNELDEEVIPESQNTPDDDELDDVTMMAPAN